MSNTSLRFLLLGEDHLQNLHFERALNELRYYRVAPAMRMQEASVMASCVENGFDVMIFSGALLNAVGNVEILQSACEMGLIHTFIVCGGVSRFAVEHGLFELPACLGQTSRSLTVDELFQLLVRVDASLYPGRSQNLSATPELLGTVLPPCPLPNPALTSVPPFNPVMLKASASVGSAA